VIGDAQRGDAYDQVRDQLREGRQAYVVYPLIDESDKRRDQDCCPATITFLPDRQPRDGPDRI